MQAVKLGHLAADVVTAPDTWQRFFSAIVGQWDFPLGTVHGCGSMLPEGVPLLKLSVTRCRVGGSLIQQ
jgi:hypothetical protein